MASIWLIRYQGLRYEGFGAWVEGLYALWYQGLVGERALRA